MWKRGKSPLMIAVRRGHINAVKLLIEHGANVNTRWSSKKDFDDTALWIASSYICPVMIDIVSLLLNNGADPNLTSGRYLCTPLHQAAYHNNIEATKLLIYHGAKVDAKDVDGETPIQVAIRSGSKQVWGWLMTIYYVNMSR